LKKQILGFLVVSNDLANMIFCSYRSNVSVIRGASR
jgi:hypothetical protein